MLISYISMQIGRILGKKELSRDNMVHSIKEIFLQKESNNIKIFLVEKNRV